MANDMSCSNDPIARTVLYGAYNLGLCIPVGLVRAIIAVAYIAKHSFYAARYELAHQTQLASRQEELSNRKRSREEQNRAAASEVSQATGVKWVWSLTKSTVTELSNSVENFADQKIFDVESVVLEGFKSAVLEIEAERRRAWNDQAIRGLTEIFWVGAPYFTYQDNFSEKPKVDCFDLDGLVEIYKGEQEDDEIIRGLLGSDYDPLF